MSSVTTEEKYKTDSNDVEQADKDQHKPPPGPREGCLGHIQDNAESWFLHPWSRIFTAYFIIVCNFLIFAEDPVAHSIWPCDLPIIGNDVTFVLAQYPPNGGQIFLKVFLWLTFAAGGAIFARQIIHHKLLRDWREISMFQQDKGTWMVMFLFNFIALYIGCSIYNIFAATWGSKPDKWVITSTMGIDYILFAKVAAIGTWLGDFVTAAMVTDMMLQVHTIFPDWCTSQRHWWKYSYNGKGRIVSFWVLFITTTAIVIGVMFNPRNFDWDELNVSGYGSSELSRAWLAAFITLFDLLIIIQDWEFPWFENGLDINLPGVNFPEIRCTCALPEIFHFTVTGKWFNYGIIFCVMLLDFNMFKNQVLYEPVLYGQYTDPDDGIWTVTNVDEVDWLFEHPEELTWEIRSVNHTLNGDEAIFAFYREYSTAAKAFAFLPIVFGLGLFWFLVNRDIPLHKDEVNAVKDETAKKELATQMNTELTQIPGRATASSDDDRADVPGVVMVASVMNEHGEKLVLEEIEDEVHVHLNVKEVKVEEK